MLTAGGMVGGDRLKKGAPGAAHIAGEPAGLAKLDEHL